ncbi:Methyltransferase-like protein 9, variant 2 [Parelaphostrongylus tenuis]|uniref:Methyltransferase-like protein 9, variant 2 n=1 Tax=Parelaphostrongylus tenuis TaxID=148309 RepID=A0AAD5MJ89_PARTN|nr:Methyltransferase-like protein 9, variant 2 [Parelaphostrongylus tenuis]
MRLYRRFSSSFLVREMVEERVSCEDRSSWYRLKAGLLSPLLQSTFMQSSIDSETRNFISDSIVISNSVCLQLYYAFMSAVLSFFLSKTSINGILNRGTMFLFSTKQLRDLLSIPAEWNPANKRVLDLGAGDGSITEKLASFYGTIHTTEISQVMEWQLRSKNFILEDVEAWSSSLLKFDLISVLNLLDSSSPVELLCSRSCCFTN